jgi:hypothetical protein
MTQKAKNIIKFGEASDIIVTEEDIKLYLRFYLNPTIRIPGIKQSVTKVKHLLSLCSRLQSAGGCDKAAQMEQ